MSLAAAEQSLYDVEPLGGVHVFDTTRWTIGTNVSIGSLG